MTNLEIDSNMTTLAKTERKITLQILELILMAERQRLPEERGFRDTYDWLIRGHGYSGGAANRRIQAARLLRDCPEVAAKVETGAVNLTTLWQAQKTIRAQQKATGQRVSLSDKKVALERIENKTSEAAERELNTLFPDGVSCGEKTVHKRDGGARITIELTVDEAREIERARELLSHALPGATLGQVVARLARRHDRRKDPLRVRRARVAPTPHCGISASVRRKVIRRSNGGCTYEDMRTGRVCGSRFQLEIDHIVPRANGGRDDLENLRCLCRRHNQLVAEHEFGREFMIERRAPI